jgi:nicotinate-nucleotide pyrophosphorylase (carboxylating)
MKNAERTNFLTLLEMAHEEDLGTGDITGKLLPAELRASAQFIARQPLRLCGGILLDRIAKRYDELIRTITCCSEGAAVQAGEVVAEWTGPAWAIVAAERVALNFLQRLSGIATLTRHYVDAVSGTAAAIYDTRKTTPGWRELEKYAVRVGGGQNHRRGLYDAVLVKDNHLVALGTSEQSLSLKALAGRLEAIARQLNHEGFVEVEVDTLEQFAEALTLPVDVILLDNMTPDQLRQAVALRNQGEPDPTIALEASGGVTLESVRAVAETGVERIAVGAVTHSAPAVDIGLDITWDLRTG